MNIQIRSMPGLLSVASAGIVIAVTNLMVEISFAALVFSGELLPFLPSGIGFYLFGAIVIGVVVTLFSAFPHAVALPQDTPTVVLAVLAGLLAVELRRTSDPEVLFATVVVTMALSAILTGALFFLLGTFGLGNLARYMPYPVIGGFLAGTGGLLVVGAIDVMADVSLSPAMLPSLFEPVTVGRWLPGLVLAIGILIVLRRYSFPPALPGILIAAIVLFHLVRVTMGGTVEGAWENGGLLGPFSNDALWQPLNLTMIQQAEWGAIILQSGTLATLLLIALLSFLLNASGLELAIEQEVDLNHELKVTGIANMLGGVGGSPVGFHALSLSALSYRLAPNGRATGLVIVAIYGLALLGGASLLSYFPTFVLGGLLLFIGLDFLVTWLVESWSRLARPEYAIVVVIALVMVFINVLEGVALGVLLAVVLFVIDYGRASPIHRVLSGESYRSTVDRPDAHRRTLQEHGTQISILELDRFIFFGTANQLLDAVRERVSRSGGASPRFLILDFRRANGLDASALSIFEKIKQTVTSEGSQLLFSALTPQMGARLDLLLAGEGRSQIKVFPDLDHAVEWCEEQILESVLPGLEQASAGAETLDGRLDHLLTYMQVLNMAPDEILIRQGEQSPGLFFLDQGHLTVQLETDEGQIMRLRKMHPGVFIGELSLYTGAPASASVRADESSTLYFLSEAELARLEAEEPATAAAFHKYIARLSSERLLDATQTISALM